LGPGIAGGIDNDSQNSLYSAIEICQVSVQLGFFKRLVGVFRSGLNVSISRSWVLYGEENSISKIKECERNPKGKLAGRGK
jgi:hypothetical protein